jgi:hypothetical protein
MEIAGGIAMLLAVLALAALRRLEPRRVNRKLRGSNRPRPLRFSDL